MNIYCIVIVYKHRQPHKCVYTNRVTIMRQHKYVYAGEFILLYCFRNDVCGSGCVYTYVHMCMMYHGAADKNS